MAWYLKIGAGDAKSFTSLGAVHLKRELRSQTPGSFTFRLPLQSMAADPIAAFDDVAMVLWEMTPFFFGRFTKIPVAGSSAEEDQTYEITDAWKDFERITFQQQWNRITAVDDTGHPTNALQDSACCLLGVDHAGAPQNSGAVIAEAVNWAIAREAQCQLGTIGPASPVPVDEVTDLPVAEIIKKMLRFTPDAVAWFDHSITPPIFNVTRRAACAPVALPFIDAGDAVNITPRNDLLVSQVLLRFEQPNISDGVTNTTVILDAAPGGADGLAFGALVSTVRLGGSNATYQKSPVKTAPIPQSGDSSASIVAWLKTKIPWLKNYPADRLEVDGYYSVAEPIPGPNANSDDDPTSYPRELVSGNLSDSVITANSIKNASITAGGGIRYLYPGVADADSRAAFKVFGPDGGSLDNWNNYVPFALTVKGTNAVTQTYAQLSGYTAPEAAPTGLAAALYSALSVLQYEGAWNAIQSEVTPTTRLGIVLNLTGGRAEWTTMNALVQEIVDDLDNGVTSYKFGPGAHLTIQDLMEQLRATRQRQESYKIGERTTGSTAVPEIDLGGETPGSDNGDPPAPTHYPWIDFIDSLDDGNGDPITYKALIGYGQSTFAFASGIDHAGPLEAFEISVGRDGSSWLDPTGASISEQTDWPNALSIISGDQTPSNDHIIIGVKAGDTEGSIWIKPATSSIWISPNIDPISDGDSTNHIKLSVADMIIEIKDDAGNKIELDDGDAPIIKVTDSSGSVGSLASSSLAINDADGSASNLTGSVLTLVDSGGGTVNCDASALGTKTAHFIELEVCVDGATKHVMALATDPY